jgi:hypothetical protein
VSRNSPWCPPRYSSPRLRNSCGPCDGSGSIISSGHEPRFSSSHAEAHKFQLCQLGSPLSSRSNNSSCPIHWKYFGFLIFSQVALCGKYGSSLRFATIPSSNCSPFRGTMPLSGCLRSSREGKANLPRDLTSIIELRSGVPDQMIDEAEQVKEIRFADVHRTTRPSSSAQFCTMTIGKSSLFSTMRNRRPSGATSSR